MRVIPIESYPLKQTYDTLEGAIAGALRDPLQATAKEDTIKLLGSRITDAWWTDTDCVISFSNGRFLRIWAVGEVVEWLVTDTAPKFDETAIERIGAPAVVCQWSTLGDVVWNRSDLAAKRIGMEFWQLFVTAGALLVYCRKQMIWWFHSVRRTDTGHSMLFTAEDD